MRNSKISILFFILCVASISCKKVTPEPIIPVNRIDFNITYKVDNEVFALNRIQYINQVGNHYSITKLVYYISQISLIKPDGSTVLLKDYHYIDAALPIVGQMSFKNIPVGNYTGIRFNIGLDSLHNFSNILPTTVENINMEWPEMMGGGYHFLKMEGYFLDSSGVSFGYAMHLGTNATLIPIHLNRNIEVKADSKFPLTVVMNINEWYRNPNSFDFNTDGNYIMGDKVKMKKLAGNANDLFSF